MLDGYPFVFVLAMDEREEESIQKVGGIPVMIPAKEIGRHMVELTLKANIG